MQLICVSRGSYSCGKAFAESLARKLGRTCIGREELLERASLDGISAGKLEIACIKPPERAHDSRARALSGVLVQGVRAYVRRRRMYATIVAEPELKEAKIHA